MIRPSPKVKTVGYQRPCAMFDTSVKELLDGSKIEDFKDPWKGSYSCVPPLMKARPSGRTTMPLQNMSHDTLNWVMLPLEGFTRRAPELFDGP
jgi:hypothetical protein